MAARRDYDILPAVRKLICHRCCLAARRQVRAPQFFPGIAIERTKLLIDGRCGEHEAAGGYYRPSKSETARRFPLDRAGIQVDRDRLSPWRRHARSSFRREDRASCHHVRCAVLCAELHVAIDTANSVRFL